MTNINNVNTTDLRPITIRHKSSGVWIGYLIGEGPYRTIEIIGRRVWSWEGSRLEMSQVSKQGCSKEDKLGEWEVVQIGCLDTDLIELRTVERSVVEAARKLEAWSA